ncbi:hypothetical protein [Nocardia sp. No.11]|uniref:hypothetical protein n=1 Tax=Nocardia sp. No.11 TaxID=3128861 RepID=UPI00319E5DCA
MLVRTLTTSTAALAALALLGAGAATAESPAPTTVGADIASGSDAVPTICNTGPVG